jgi:hypothetical protein
MGGCRADDSSFGEEAAGEEDEERLQGARKNLGKAAAIVQRWGRKVKQNIDSAVPQVRGARTPGWLPLRLPDHQAELVCCEGITGCACACCA